MLDFTTDSPIFMTGPTLAPFLDFETTPAMLNFDLATTSDPFSDLGSWNDLFPSAIPSGMPDFDFTTPMFSLDDIFEKQGGG